MWCRAFEVNFGDVLFPKEELLNVASSGVATSSPLAFMGEFTDHQHDVSGSVYAINETLLLVKGFTYDGLGPDAFFWAGTDSDRPTTEGKFAEQWKKL